MRPVTLVWFRRDLRLSDNPALRDALGGRGAVLPVYVHAPEEEAPWAPGAASNWWLHHSLERLGAELERRGSRLIVRRGASARELSALARESGAKAVVWNRLVEPAIIARDRAVEDALWSEGIEVRTHNAALLFEPGSILSGAGEPYRMFTPFWKRCARERVVAAAGAPPRQLPSPPRWPRGVTLASLGLLPRSAWDGGLRAEWTPGEAGARERLRRFLDVAGDYAAARDLPARPGTSRLSPHLHFGEISPRHVWQAIGSADLPGSARAKFLAELGWREFAHHLLWHFPGTPDRPLRGEFARFPWRRSRADLRAWQSGRTGYPIVDAGMRELWATGWMHNRVRMIVASFLVKHLLLSWREGARWFWDTLVDADLANNTLGWQWAAGCGADAAPYFRVFNPARQAGRYDAEGDYVRRWAGAESYPRPIVEHRAARTRALAAFDAMRTGRNAPPT